MPYLDMKVCKECRDIMSDEQTCESGLITEPKEYCPFCNKPKQLYTMRPMYVINLFKKYVSTVEDINDRYLDNKFEKF